MTAHFLYEQELPLGLWKDWTPRGVWRLREKFIILGKRFLSGAIPVPKVTPEFRAKWQQSKLIYEARLVESKPRKAKPSLPVTFDHE
jgi:hypothetical protein